MFNYKHAGKKVIEANFTNNKVYISMLAFKKMTTYIKECSKEIGWLGTVKEVPSGYFIEDVFLFKQEVHQTTCEITPEGLSDFVMELYNKYDSDTAMEISNSIMLWGHSHVNMGVSPSSQDVKQLASFKDCDFPYFLGVIGNKKGEFNFTLNHYQSGVIVKDLDWELYIPELDDEALTKEIKAEIKEKVKDLPICQPITRDMWSNWNVCNPGGTVYLDNKTSPAVVAKNDILIDSPNISASKSETSISTITTFKKESMLIDSLYYHLIDNINKSNKPIKEKNAEKLNIESNIENLREIIQHYDLSDLINYAEEITPDNKDKIVVDIENYFMDPYLDDWGKEYDDPYSISINDEVIELTSLTLDAIEFIRRNLRLVMSL